MRKSTAETGIGAAAGLAGSATEVDASASARTVTETGRRAGAQRAVCATCGASSGGLELEYRV